MSTMKTLAAALAAAMLGIAGNAGAVTGDQDISRENNPSRAPAMAAPGVLEYKVHPGDLPPAAMRRGQANRYERAAQGHNNGYYAERPPQYRSYDRGNDRS